MKKLLALLLALMMLFSVATVFAGCEDSGKKKSSSSSDDDDEDEEDEEDDEDEDEDKDEDEDEDKDKEDDEKTGNDKPDDGKDYTEPDSDDEPTSGAVTRPLPTEPIEPDPTEAPRPVEPDDEWLDSPYEDHDGDTDVYICAQILSGNEYQYFEIAKQKLGENEGFIYYCDETDEILLYIANNAIALYLPDDDGTFYVDTQTDTHTKMQMLENMSNIWKMFIDFDGMLGEDVRYLKIGEENDASGYEAYKNGQLVRTFYIDIETGITMYIQDEYGNDMMWIEQAYLDFDLTRLIG